MRVRFACALAHLASAVLRSANVCAATRGARTLASPVVGKRVVTAQHSFAAGESALLIDEDQSSLATKKRVARVVCHELSHQWWGNLVTMQWWTHLWLVRACAPR